MQVLRFEVSNFRSIPNAKLDFNYFNIFIGKNNAGKSNLVNSIYRYRDLMVEKIEADSLHEEAVTRGNDSKPIEFSVTFEINEDTRERIIEKIASSHGISSHLYDEYIDGEQFSRFEHDVGIRREGLSHNSIKVNIDDDMVELGTIADGGAEYLDLENLPKIERDHDLDLGDVKIKSVLPNTIAPYLVREFESWNMVAPFRQPGEWGSFVAETELEPSGENLTSVIQALRGDGTDRYNTICNTYKEIMEGIEEVRISTEENEVGEAVPIIRVDEESSKGIGLEELSSGSKEILILVTKIILAKSDTSILYIEEPELHLHPAAERQIYREITEIAGEEKAQVIVTTHSGVFVDQVDIEHIFSVKRDDHTYIETVDEGGLGEELAALGYPKSELLQADRVIFVEGRSDRVVLINWAKTLGMSFSVNGVEPIVFNGDEIFEEDNPYANSVPDVLSQLGIPYLYIFDSDGDEPADKQEDIVGRLSESASDVKVLDYYCIESYLAKSPRAVAQPLGKSEDIDEIAEELPNEPGSVNMKSRFDELFKRHLDTRYNEESHGAAIAGNMQKEEIEPEIKELISEIVTMEGR